MPQQNKFQHVLFFSALAVFVRSPAAYEALKSFNILQLPSRATLQEYTGAFLDSPGAFMKFTL
ncbi:MAG: hypothetical protein MJE68_12450 [Proteobacteria bacterium]|nr:hypothetical protein [Pseudomonadota bacterium]